MACDLEKNSDKHTVQLSITDVTEDCGLGQKTYTDGYVPLPKSESINDQALPFHFSPKMIGRWTARTVLVYCFTIFLSVPLVWLFFDWEVASRRLIMSQINYPSEGDLENFRELLEKTASFNIMSENMFSQVVCVCIAHASNSIVGAYFAWRSYKQQNQELEIKEKNRCRVYAIGFLILAVSSPLYAYLFSSYAREALKDADMSHSMIRDIIRRQPCPKWYTGCVKNYTKELS